MAHAPYDRAIAIVVSPFILLAVFGHEADVNGDRAEIHSNDCVPGADARHSDVARRGRELHLSRTESARPCAASVRVRDGEMVGIMGASGAGKSTLAKCLNWIVPGFEDGEFRGVVRIGGGSLDGARVCDVAPTVGMVFQDFEAQLFSTNVAHEVAFAMEQVGMERDEMAAPHPARPGGGRAGRLRAPRPDLAFRRRKAAAGDRVGAGSAALGDRARRADD